jgi:hypothetical protein
MPVITTKLIAIIASLIGFPPLIVLAKALPKPKFNGDKLVQSFQVSHA